MAQLTKDQIQELYNFTQRHYVVHYDLQTELVDHLANGIEEQWKRYPQRTFDEARLVEFRKFGICGFEEVIKQKRRFMRKRYLNIVSVFCKDFFKIPKIILVFALVLIVTLALLWVPVTFRYDTISGLLYAMLLVQFYLIYSRRKENRLHSEKHGKRWMLKDQIYGYSEMVSYVNLIPILLNSKYLRNAIPIDNLWVLLLFSFLITSVIIISYVTFFVIPSKADELLAQTYPEYKWVNNL